MEITATKTVKETVTIKLPEYFVVKEKWLLDNYFHVTENRVVLLTENMILATKIMTDLSMEKVSENGFTEITESEFNEQLNVVLEKIKTTNHLTTAE